MSEAMDFCTKNELERVYQALAEARAELAALRAAQAKLAKDILDTGYAIIKACTYQGETSAAAGRYALPYKCFEDLDKLIQQAHDIELPAPPEVEG